MDHNEMIAVILAQKAGAQIEARASSNSAWFDIGVSEKFDFASYVYRVKPQPREWWMPPSHAHQTARPVETTTHPFRPDGYIRVREVL